MAALWQRSELVSRQRLYASLALTGLQLQGIAIATTGIWLTSALRLQAETVSFDSPQLLEAGQDSSDLSLPVLSNPVDSTTSAKHLIPPSPQGKEEMEASFSDRGQSNGLDSTPVAEMEILPPVPGGNVANDTATQADILTSAAELEEAGNATGDESAPFPLERSPFLIAAPQNFNPGLRLPPPSPESPDVTSNTGLDNLQVDFKSDRDNFGQNNLFIEPTVRYRLSNGNSISLKTGLNRFEQEGFESITNIPLQVGWQGKINDVNVQAAAGLDFFDRLPTAVNLNAKVDVPIGQNLTLSAVVEQQPYKFNAQTLENQITAWRFGPNLYWQINPNTSLFSLLRFGSYNDGNSEQQSFSRLEHKIGQFTVAANLFNLVYERDVQEENGYFSPPDFLVYNAEIGWEGDVFDFLRCRLSGTLGQQRLQGKFNTASSYQARCTARLSENLEADLGYVFSNIRNFDTGSGNYNNQSLTGQLRLKF